MDRNVAAVLFLAVCIILAVLLLARAITPLVSGTVFAIALALFGLAARGFRKRGGL